ncbi:MAG TPA: PQQ-binding-like beta-propeller repeat protein, partial [Polyangiaceae bacterium]|nr:PQQ-binding-like beta-propeller repeat protein [Polyangiaceae bacterium]
LPFRPRLPPAAAPRHAPEPVALAPLWTFHAGAPLRAGAGVGKGGIGVGSGDGYVHALRADGAYRWSFTVKGAVVATPLVDARGAVYVATSSRKLHALTPAGTLGWSVTLAGVAIDALRWSKDGEMLIATREGIAYAITTSGVVKAAAALKEPLTTPPLPLPSGRWLVGGERGHVFSFDGWRVSQERPVTSPVLALAPRAEGYAGLSAAGLFWPGQSPEQRARQLGCGPERVLVAGEDGAIGWLDGNAVGWVGTVGELSAAPACSRDGRALLPLASGALVVLAGAEQRRYSLGSAALFTPTIDEARGQVVVSSADGRSRSLPLGAL